MKVAAVQLEPRIADVPANLEACERLAGEAAAAGAEWIVLPEFFTTGMGFVPELADTALRPDGEATDLLLDLARRHGATVGGSFLCRDPDGEVRNAFVLATPDGIAGRHDKDLPTMWENAFYVGGDDDGLIRAGELDVGAAVCWEFMRTQTARRLRGRVDIVVGGSFWWSMPDMPPRAVMRRREPANERLAVSVGPAMARFVARRSCTPRTAARSPARCRGARSATAGTSRAAPRSPTGTAASSRSATAGRVRASRSPTSSPGASRRASRSPSASGCTAATRSRRSHGPTSARTGAAGTPATCAAGRR